MLISGIGGDFCMFLLVAEAALTLVQEHNCHTASFPAPVSSCRTQAVIVWHLTSSHQFAFFKPANNPVAAEWRTRVYCRMSLTIGIMGWLGLRKKAALRHCSRSCIHVTVMDTHDGEEQVIATWWQQCLTKPCTQRVCMI